MVEFPEVAAAIEAWRGQGEARIPTDQIKRAAGVSRPTALGWVRGEGDPKATHIRRLEAFKPGLIALLFPEPLTGQDAKA